MNCKGEVYEDTSAAGPLDKSRFKSTSPAQDAEIRKYFYSLLGQQGKYFLIGNSCRDFSQRVYWELGKRYFPRESPPF
jgi:hypothetical protein